MDSITSKIMPYLWKIEIRKVVILKRKLGNPVNKGILL